MQHLLERIKAGTLWDFHGGIHPPENKHQSSLTPVVDAGLPPQLIIPVRQHAGPAGELLVRVGTRYLLKGLGAPASGIGGLKTDAPVPADARAHVCRK